MLWGGGEAGSYTSAALQEGITMGGSKAWDLEAPGMAVKPFFPTENLQSLI